MGYELYRSFSTVGAFKGIAGLEAVIIFFVLAVTVFWFLMLFDCITKEPDTGDNRITWVVLIAVTHWVGAALYFFWRRPRRIAELGR